MHRLNSPYRVAQYDPGPLYIGAGLAIVLAAQIWPAVPLVTAIALIGWGATLALVDRRQHELVLALNVAIYVSLALLAIGAQLDEGSKTIVLCDTVAALGIAVRTMPRWPRRRPRV